MSRLRFYCQNCGHETPKWHGKCPSCKEWNSIVEEVQKTTTTNQNFGLSSNQEIPTLIQNVTNENIEKNITNDAELNVVLGGGIVSGSMILLAGEPGIGKSTLLLQMALKDDKNVLYVSGEEAATQIKIRANRIGIVNQHCHIYSETSSQKIVQHCIKSQNKYKYIIVDSIQTIHSDFIASPIGSVSQIKQSCSELLKYAKESSTSIILIGHITKEGQIAGPKVLEHMVDVVLHFEGQKTHLYRILRSKKNRFGSTSKVGIYEMEESGLRPVLNPSTILINDRNSNLSGTAIATAFEGHKTFLVEIQALVTPAVYGTPQRTANGFNLKRLHMLLAVLEKKGGFKFSSQDIFLNIAGGINVSDPSMDLGVIVSLISSNKDINIPSNICFSGEVGLNGEIRPLPLIDSHIQEAERIGFRTIVISSYNKTIHLNSKIKIIQCSELSELYTFLSKL